MMNEIAGGSFEACWPGIARQLETVLARRGIDAHTREDLVQETALRLIQRWEGLDKDSAIMPFAVTIALNLMRDRFRRSGHEVIVDVDSNSENGDVEREGLARLELARVARAMRSLSPSHRQVLLASVAEPSEMEPVRTLAPAPATAVSASKSATKMMRMRARRRLLTLLESTAAVVGTFRLKMSRALNDPMQAVAAIGTSAVLASAVVVVPERHDSGAPGAPSPSHAERADAGGSPGEIRIPSGSPSSARSTSGAKEVEEGTRSVHVATPERSGSADDDKPEQRGSEVAADVSADPTGDSDVEVDAGVAAARVRQTQDPGGTYGACIAVQTQPFSGDACGDAAQGGP